MRVTPLDIRQKTFEKNFRGYEKDEVNAFSLRFPRSGNGYWMKIKNSALNWRLLNAK
jgi:DivIVA domain-containing protein